MEIFDYTEFKKEFECGDLCGLEYIEETLIEGMKQKNKGAVDITREDYIIDLFYAVKSLNSCNNLYEITRLADNFDYDLYFATRDLLFKELDLVDILEEV